MAFRFDRWLTIHWFQPLRKVSNGRTGAALPVLMYHSISTDPEPGVSPYYRTCTGPDLFRRQMEWLHERGYKTVDVEALLDRGESRDGAGRKPVVITFDDGFRDFYTEAMPALDRFGFTAIVYLPTAFIGDRRRSFQGRECLTWGEVCELSARGIRFGSHTVNHPILYDLCWQEIEKELRDSGAEISDRLQARIGAFAYPYAFPQQDGAFVSRFKDALSGAGYDSAVTTMIGRAKCGDDLLALKRLPVNSGDDRALFTAKLEGAYDWLAGVQSALKRLKRFRSRRTT